MLGEIALAHGRYETAIEHFKRAVSAGNVNAMFFLGIAFEQDGQVKEAIDTFLSVRAGTMYRVFALGRATCLLADLPRR